MLPDDAKSLVNHMGSQPLFQYIANHIAYIVFRSLGNNVLMFIIWDLFSFSLALLNIKTNQSVSLSHMYNHTLIHTCCFGSQLTKHFFPAILILDAFVTSLLKTKSGNLFIIESIRVLCSARVTFYLDNRIMKLLVANL